MPLSYGRHDIALPDDGLTDRLWRTSTTCTAALRAPRRTEPANTVARRPPPVRGGVWAATCASAIAGDSDTFDSTAISAAFHTCPPAVDLT